MALTPAGTGNTGQSGPPGPMNYVWAAWTVPAVVNSDDGSNVAQWVGLDGAGTPSLVQDGVDSYVTNVGGSLIVQSFFWWEEVPSLPGTLFPGNPGVSAGDLVEAVTSVIANNNQMPSATFTIFNISKSTYSVASYPIREGFVGATAEWIVENPLFCDGANCGTDLADFASFGMYGAGGYLGSPYSYVYHPGGSCWTTGGYRPPNCGAYRTIPITPWTFGFNQNTNNYLDYSWLYPYPSNTWVGFEWWNPN